MQRDVMRVFSQEENLFKNRSERREFECARSAGTGVYLDVHEVESGASCLREHRTRSKYRAQQVFGQVLDRCRALDPYMRRRRPRVQEALAVFATEL